MLHRKDRLTKPFCQAIRDDPSACLIALFPFSNGGRAALVARSSDVFQKTANRFAGSM